MLRAAMGRSGGLLLLTQGCVLSGTQGFTARPGLAVRCVEADGSRIDLAVARSFADGECGAPAWPALTCAWMRGFAAGFPTCVGNRIPGDGGRQNLFLVRDVDGGEGDTMVKRWSCEADDDHQPLYTMWGTSSMHILGDRASATFEVGPGVGAIDQTPDDPTLWGTLDLAWCGEVDAGSGPSWPTPEDG